VDTSPRTELMTRPITNTKLRAVFLAALMFLWVFAGTMAFAGGAAAQSIDNRSDVTVAPGGQVTITAELDGEGNDLTAYGETIEDGAPLTVVDGSSQTDFASVQVDNPDEEEDLFVLYFSTTESTQTDTVEFTVEADADATPGDTFDITGDLTAGSESTTDTLTVEIVEEEASLSVDNLDPADGEAQTDTDVDVTADITNSGPVEGTADVDLLVNGTVEDTQTVTVPGGATEPVSFTLTTPPEPAELTHSIELTAADSNTTIDLGSVSGTLSVVNPPVFEIPGTLDDQTVAQGETATVSTTVENTGGAGEQTVTLTVGDDTQTQTVSIDAGATQQVTFDVDTTDVPPGAYAVAVNTDDADATATLTVEASVETYRPAPGESVNNSGVTQAILDWQQGDIGNDLIVDVVLDWQN
jgi:surface glycoprotein (TIGR04207 family)